jgi:hypothetical protein
MSADPLDADEARAIALDVARLVRERYVFADEAAVVADAVERRVADGGYDAIHEVEHLAAALTADLQSVNGDRHLRVLFAAEPVADLADPEAELAMWRDRARADAGGMAKVELLADGIGLLEVRPILYPAVLSGEAIAAAMTLLADARALIVDVRGCVGGSPEAVALLCSYLVDDEPVHLNTMVDRGGDPVQSWTLAWVPGRRFGAVKPVAVLTGPKTFSGGEELAYDLQQLGRATIVGEATGGGANPRQGHRVHPHLEATIPVARPVNPVSGSNWELVGVTPDVAASSDAALDRAVELLSR